MKFISLKTVARRLVFLLPGLVGGCISVPQSLRTAVSTEGAHATSAMAVGPVFLIRTASYLPGRSGSSGWGWDEVGCRSTTADVLLVAERRLALGAEDMRSTCERALSAADYVLAFVRPVRTVRYRLELYSPYRQVVRRSRAFYPLGGRTAYAFHWSSTGASLAELVDTVSHETLHLAASIARLPKARRGSEPVAYLAGACGQLAALRSVDLRTRPVAFGADDPIPGGARESGAAGAAMWEALAREATNGRIRLDSPAGQVLQARCSAALDAFFGPASSGPMPRRQLLGSGAACGPALDPRLTRIKALGDPGPQHVGIRRQGGVSFSEGAMEFHIRMAASLPELGVIDDAIRSIDPAALVDIDEDGDVVRVATSLPAAELASLITAACTHGLRLTWIKDVPGPDPRGIATIPATECSGPRHVRLPHAAPRFAPLPRLQRPSPEAGARVLARPPRTRSIRWPWM